MVDNVRCQFAFRKVMNNAGALYPDPAFFTINLITGKPSDIYYPDIKINTPVPEPTVTRAEALVIAKRLQKWDSLHYPFSHIELLSKIDDVGIIHSFWVLNQDGPGNSNSTQNWFTVTINAYQVDDYSTLLVEGDKRSSTQSANLSPRILVPEIRPNNLGGRETVYWDGAAVYFRVELLKKLSATVDVGNAFRSVTWNGKKVNSSDLDPRPKLGGWYVSLKLVAEKFGWKLTWDPIKLEAVLISGNGKKEKHN